MNDSKPRKPGIGHKGTLPGNAGRYSMSSRPPTPPERQEFAFDPEIPGPARIPQEAAATPATTLETPPLVGEGTPKAGPTAAPRSPADWKGTTLGGWGTEVARGTSMANLRSTLGLGSSEPPQGSEVPRKSDRPRRSEKPPESDHGPGTIRGTPPPPGPSLLPVEPVRAAPTGVAARRISVPDVERPRADQRRHTPAPDSPRTQRGVPPARDATAHNPVRLIEVDPVRMGSGLNTTLPPSLMPICEEIGNGSAGTTEVSLLAAPSASRNSLYVGAIAIARRMAQVLPGQVVLVETDFETPALASTLGVSMPRGRGFSEQLHARAWGGESGRWHLVNPGLGFDVLCEGRIRTPGLLWSDHFSNAIATLRATYSVVLLIAPNRITAVDHRALDDVTTAVYGLSKEGASAPPTQLARGPLTRKVRLAPA